jgi:hypothetical protein
MLTKLPPVSASQCSTHEPVARNARREAEERLGGRYEARVLEPSPPAVMQAPWFAEDPTAPEERDSGRPLVTPVSGGDLLWDELALQDERLAQWCAQRWLGAYRRLGEPPATLARTRKDLHRLAEHVISPTRKRANGKIGLRWTLGGFGTPFFGKDVQIRVVGDVLIVQVAGQAHSGRLTTLADAAEFIGFDLTRFDLGGVEEPLQVDPAASCFLGGWFGFATSVLAQLRAESPHELEDSHVQLWPEHFDLAAELGSESDGARATYGFSPGDEQHPEPYAYVAPWSGAGQGELWGARGFAGAELGYAELLAAADQRETALAFMRTRRDALVARS